MNHMGSVLNYTVPEALHQKQPLPSQVNPEGAEKTHQMNMRVLSEILNH